MTHTLELKQYIRTATPRGFLLVCGGLLGVGVVAGLYSFSRRLEMPSVVRVNTVKLSNLQTPHQNTLPPIPPPSVLLQTASPQSAIAARAGTPVPVPDALLRPDEIVFANVDQISYAHPEGGTGELGNMSLTSEVTEEVRDETESNPYIFIPVEREPYVDSKELSKRFRYPEAAKRLGLEGTVAIRVLIGKDGVPQKYLIERSTDSLFHQAAVNAVMQASFVPALQNNQPIKCWVSIPIQFRLR
jgi:protein TonB